MGRQGLPRRLVVARDREPWLPVLRAVVARRHRARIELARQRAGQCHRTWPSADAPARPHTFHDRGGHPVRDIGASALGCHRRRSARLRAMTMARFDRANKGVPFTRRDADRVEPLRRRRDLPGRGAPRVGAEAQQRVDVRLLPAERRLARATRQDDDVPRAVRAAAARRGMGDHRGERASGTGDARQRRPSRPDRERGHRTRRHRLARDPGRRRLPDRVLRRLDRRGASAAGGARPARRHRSPWRADRARRGRRPHRGEVHGGGLAGRSGGGRLAGATRRGCVGLRGDHRPGRGRERGGARRRVPERARGAGGGDHRRGPGDRRRRVRRQRRRQRLLRPGRRHPEASPFTDAGSSRRDGVAATSATTTASSTNSHRSARSREWTATSFAQRSRSGHPCCRDPNPHD